MGGFDTCFRYNNNTISQLYKIKERKFFKILALFNIIN